MFLLRFQILRVLNNLIRPALLITAAGLAALTAAAQQPQPLPTVAELRKNLDTIAASTEVESEDLIAQTSRQLVRYLKAQDLSDAAAKELGLDVTTGPADAAHLKVYTFSFSSGGTRGTVDRPVLQWKNAAGKRFAYALDEECSFANIHPLAVPGRTLYLLLGEEQGDSQCVYAQAFVIELKGDYLRLDSKAFGNSSSLRLCNAAISFEASKQAFVLDLTTYLKERDKAERLEDEQYLAQKGYRRQPGMKRLTLQFRNGRFVQQP